jgi:hypothetical protein
MAARLTDNSKPGENQRRKVMGLKLRAGYQFIYTRATIARLPNKAKPVKTGGAKQWVYIQLLLFR